MISYAQNFEDVLLNRVFSDVATGFYVDVGAHHPSLGSVTKHFYDKGWRGINIEPGSIFKLIEKERPRDINLRVAVSDRPGTAVLYEHRCPELSGISSLSPVLPESVKHLAVGRVAREVKLRTLQDIFAEYAPQRIEFMSVDVEGHEKQVLLGNDWSRFRPRTVLVEATVPLTNIPCHQEWEPILLEAGYDFAYFDGINRFYVRAEDSRLRQCFALPVNVLDCFELAEIVRQRQQIAAQRQQIAAQRQQIAAQRQQIEWYTRRTGPKSLSIGLRLARQIHRLTRL